MARIIELDERNKIVNIRQGTALIDGKKEIFSEEGLLGWIMTSDRVFKRDIYIDERDLSNKLNELSNMCNAEILSGFKSSAKGVEKLYDFEYENQINICDIKNNLLMGVVNEYEYYAKHEDCELYTKEEFLQLYNDAMNHKFINIKKYKTLSTQAKACTLKTELEQIRW